MLINCDECQIYMVSLAAGTWDCSYLRNSRDLHISYWKAEMQWAIMRFVQHMGGCQKEPAVTDPY